MYNLRTVNKYKPPKGLHPAVKDSEEILKDESTPKSRKDNLVDNISV